jgi:hypothetical protein
MRVARLETKYLIECDGGTECADTLPDAISRAKKMRLDTTCTDAIIYKAIALVREHDSYSEVSVVDIVE